MKRSIIFIARSAIISAIYLALSMALPAIAFGPVQFRLSEALCLLPTFLPESIPGLIIGCLLTNIFSGFGVYDMVIGTLATALAVLCTRLLKKHLVLAAIPPIIFNALLVPVIFILCGAAPETYGINFAQILLSQFLVCGVIGVPITIAIRKALVAAHLIYIPNNSKITAPAYKRITKDTILTENQEKDD